MIVIIRIKGQTGLRKDTNNTLDRLRIKKKYSCVVVKETKENLGMINKLTSFIAYGKINEDDLIELIEKRGIQLDKNKKIDARKAAEEIVKGKKLEDMNLKPFFRLHPPRKGIKSKLHYPRGVLGNHGDKINLLLKRML